jgi:hypothetical protein
MAAKKKVKDLSTKAVNAKKAEKVRGGELLSSVSKTRSEISATFAQNARA